MKYDSQLGELKNLLPTAKSILIALPANPSVDILASGLALFLTLEAAGKEASIVCETDIKVGQSHLFGVDHVQKNIPSTEGGNLTLTMEGVAASDNTVPALEKLDWFAENSSLNLVFHVLPNQTFQPARIVPHYQGGGFNLIFTVGAVNLNALGQIYQSQNQVFSGVHVVNIDSQVANTGFGQTNVVDSNSSSVSEIVANILADLGFNPDADIASNLLAGIFDATNNLTGVNLGAETYMAVANCLRVGGKKPAVQTASVQPTPVSAGASSPTPAFDWSALMPTPIQSGPKAQPQQPSAGTPDFTMPPVVSNVTSAQSVVDAGDHETVVYSQAGGSQSTPQTPSGSPEERPSGEGVISETVEPEWLTPKIFKGSSIG